MILIQSLIWVIGSALAIVVVSYCALVVGMMKPLENTTRDSRSLDR